MMLTWLADELRAAGLDVVEDPGWESRGEDWHPIGCMQHHTAPPVPYPVDGLNGSRDSRIKCNINIKPNGRVILIAAGAPNYAGGPGSGVVRSETMRSIAPSGMARDRRLENTTTGNRSYIHIEADHPGDGSTIPSVQYFAIVDTWAVICAKMEWSPNRIIAHGEWTWRKIDPRWDGRDAHENANQIRDDVTFRLGTVLEGTKMLKRGDQGRQVRILQKSLNQTPNPPRPPLVVDGDYGLKTEKAVLRWQERREIPNPDGIYDAFTRADVERQQTHHRAEEEE